MNANLTLSEILTISVIVLIVFGPHRLPELARRAGIVVGKLRQAAANVRQELTAGTEDLAKPLADIQADLKAAKEDLRAALPDLSGPSLGDGTRATPKLPTGPETDGNRRSDDSGTPEPPAAPDTGEQTAST